MPLWIYVASSHVQTLFLYAGFIQLTSPYKELSFLHPPYLSTTFARRPRIGHFLLSSLNGSFSSWLRAVGNRWIVCILVDRSIFLSCHSVGRLALRHRSQTKPTIPTMKVRRDILNSQIKLSLGLAHSASLKLLWKLFALHWKNSCIVVGRHLPTL